jgi:Domain of unknown function (DUF4861)
MRRFVLLIAIAFAFASSRPPAFAQSSNVIVTVHNPLNLARSNETITLDASKLRTLLAVDDIRRVHVRDLGSGEDLLTQAVDSKGDRAYDELIFQTDIGPNTTEKFALSVGQRRIPTVREFKAYGRFVREREDDFAWENDRIADRMYGPALETSLIDPLTSSAVDVWVKSVSRLVINNWYMVDDYHHDHGEGGDFYDAGTTRGCGGNGIWRNGQLYGSPNFISTRVLANGPIRLLFELTYPAWDAGGMPVDETKRVTLDAGQNFNRFESHYAVESRMARLTDAIGIRKGNNPRISESRETATMRSWETLPADHGQLGCAVIGDPASFADFKEDSRNFLMIASVPESRVAVYYAGFGWSKGGFPTLDAWDKYVKDYAEALRSPLEVTISGQ